MKSLEKKHFHETISNLFYLCCFVVYVTFEIIFKFIQFHICDSSLGHAIGFYLIIIDFWFFAWSLKLFKFDYWLRRPILENVRHKFKLTDALQMNANSRSDALEVMMKFFYSQFILILKHWTNFDFGWWWSNGKTDFFSYL